jgi:hypothetical protein
MLNSMNDFRSRRHSRPAFHRGFRFQFGKELSAATCLILIAALFQSACFFRGEKKAVIPSKPVRIAFLPFNTPEGKSDLQWTSMAMPIMMARIVKGSQGLDLVPFWESMQYTLESVQNSRTITEKDAAYVANWVNAKWAAMGELSQKDKDRLNLLIDYIPPQEVSVPFRYVKKVKMEAIDVDVRRAFKQFLHYISASPLESAEKKTTNLTSLRQLAEALDTEYGWTVPADPGKARDIVANLAQSDRELARYLFNPSVYPILQDK